MSESVRCAISPSDAAVKLGVSAETLKRWREQGIGPVYHKWYSGAVTYNSVDLDDWSRKVSARTCAK